MGFQIDYDGVHYTTLAELVRAKTVDGVSYAMVSSRIKLGWSVKDSLSIPKTQENIIRCYEVDGITYKSLKELAKAAGISYVAAFKRMQRGSSDSEIFHGKAKKKKTKQAPPKKGYGKKINISGTEYRNLKVAYDLLMPSISYNTVRQRILYGWSLEEALELVPKVDGRKDGKAKSDRAPRETPRLEVDGILYKSIAELANAFGLDYSLVYNRIFNNRWSPEKAVKEVIGEKVVINGKSYKSPRAAWESIGTVTESNFSSRKAQGLPIEICLGLSPLPKEDKYFVNGTGYPSLEALAVSYDLTPGQLVHRLRTMNVEDAVIYKPTYGGYTQKRFDDDPQLALLQGALYFVSIEQPEGVLHKIGITRYSAANRLQSYKYRPIIQATGNLRELFEIEQTILNEFHSLKYRADESFDGKTETFLLNDAEIEAMRKAIFRVGQSYPDVQIIKAVVNT